MKSLLTILSEIKIVGKVNPITVYDFWRNIDFDNTAVNKLISIYNEKYKISRPPYIKNLINAMSQKDLNNFYKELQKYKK